MEKTLSQRLLAEFVGALTLIFIGGGSIIAASLGDGGLITKALAHGLAIAVMVSALGHVSGAHFNPAITVGVWIAQKIRSSDALAYIVAQLAGAAAGAGLLRVALPRTVWDQPGINLGTPSIPGGISNGQAVLIEAVLTFFLVWVVFATALDPEGSFAKIAGLAIGFTIAMDIMMGGPFTGAAMNPARHVGPALLSGTWKSWWVWWIGPVAGGIVAAALYDGVILRKKAAVAEAEGMEVPHGVGAHGEDEPLGFE